MPRDGKVLQTEYVLNGSFGELYVEDPTGNDLFPDTDGFVAECQSIQATIRGDRRDIKRSGTRQVGYKLMTIMGEGTIGTVKSTSRWQQLMTEILGSDDKKQRILKMIVHIDDPEALKNERFALLGVRVWEAPLGFNVNDVIEENITFNFEGYQAISHIDGNDLLRLQRASVNTS